MRDRMDKHILVVDDEPDLCWVLCRILEDEGYRVSTADSGEEAIDIVEKGDIDLIILDVLMPEIDGLEAYRRIKKMDASLPVIMITGHASMDKAMEAIKLGAVDYIAKPFRSEHVTNVIKLALSDRT